MARSGENFANAAHGLQGSDVDIFQSFVRLIFGFSITNLVVVLVSFITAEMSPRDVHLSIV
jgi:hypothetical protein